MKNIAKKKFSKLTIKTHKDRVFILVSKSKNLLNQF